MLETFKNIFRIKELRWKIGFTLLMIFIYRLGGHIPTPGIDPQGLGEFFTQAQNNLLGMYDMFVGGAFERATIFALGIMPYISASIIIQLLGSVFPYFHKLQREGAEGRKKITQFTRYGTILLALVQSVGVALYLQSIRVPSTGLPVVIPSIFGLKFIIVSAICMTTGTVFIMWLGEQITNRGIGNGMSLIIFIGILADIPNAVISEAQLILNGTRHPFVEVLVVAVILAMTAFIVMMTQATRRIPIQTPKKVVGTKMYAGQNTVLPLRVSMAGVIPIIFASSLIMIPNMMMGFVKADIFESLMRAFQPGAILYNVFFFLLIVFFTYFYTAIIFNPIDIADNLKRSGGFIPGIRPGKKTAEFLDKVLTRITLPGAIFLAVISIAPYYFMQALKISFFFGGTSVLIVVGVALDTLQQLESQLQTRNYEGFMKKGRIRGRRGF